MWGLINGLRGFFGFSPIRYEPPVVDDNWLPCWLCGKPGRLMSAERCAGMIRCSRCVEL